MPMEPPKRLCPRCNRDSMDGPNCLFCGPDAHGPKSNGPVHGGWKGFDRDLGARVKAQRARAVAEDRETEEKVRRFSNSWVVSAIVAVLVTAGAGYLWKIRALDTEVPSGVTGLPQKLRKAASPARTELGLYARSLHELTLEAQKKLMASDEPSQQDVAALRQRLTNLHDTSRSLEPMLTREEGRVLGALQRAERLTERYIRSFQGASPDLSGGLAETSLEQIARALAVIRGEPVEELVVTYAKKASAAEELRRALEGR